MGADLRIDCPECKGKAGDCKACDGWGVLTIKQCPRTMRDPAIDGLIDLSDLAAEGYWPVGAGSLSESDSFINAHAFIQGINSKILNLLKKPNGK